MRGSCLTQNGAWFRSQKESEGERETYTEWGRESSTTQRTHLSSLSLDCSLFFFLPLFCFLFCFHRTETVALSSYTSPLFLSAHPHLLTPLVCFFFFFWTTACHHQQQQQLPPPPPQVTDSWQAERPAGFWEGGNL